MRHQAHGYSMIELVIALALAATLLSGIGLLASRSQSDQRVTQVQQQLVLITQAVATLYPPTANNYSGLTTATVAGLLPSDMVMGTALINPWGGSYMVSAQDYATAGDQALVAITIAGQVPPTACVALARNTGDSFDQVWVNGTQVKTTISPTTWAAPSALISACASQASPTVIWKKL